MSNYLGIIGGGPRGLSALESLMAKWCESNLPGIPQVHLFEPLSYPGAGQVYDLDQSSHNWLNVPERLLDLPARNPIELNDYTLPGFPSYWEFAGIDVENLDPDSTDRYPTRAELGRYLHARFNTLAKKLDEFAILTLHRERVIGVKPCEFGWQIITSTGASPQVHELVIAVGHQPTEVDKQMARWLGHEEQYPDLHCISNPFPVERVGERIVKHKITSVALRGFGLSMIDVMKYLTEGLGGCYECNEDHPSALRYVASGAEPDYLIPFSLDGLPLGPKPVNASVDKSYAPKADQLEQLTAALEASLHPESDNALKPVLIQAMARITASVFLDLGEQAREHGLSEDKLEELVKGFLVDPESAIHPLIDRTLPVERALRGYIEMACGRSPASLDYCLGQVWRHAQPTLYRTLSYRLPGTPDQADVIALDERMKRYAFGPPVASLERILALHAAGILILDVLSDPDIQLSEAGWTLQCGTQVRQATTMVDTILDSTTVSKVTSELFETLMENGVLTQTHPNLGVATAVDATAIASNEEPVEPEIAVLGRLAQGTLIGVDAILECFGDRPNRWADGVIRRLARKTHKQNSKEPLPGA